MTQVETERAREFIENGDEEMANLQLDLLEATASAAEREALAEQTEIAALGAEKDVMVEQAAYEFLVEQILASGVAAFWSAP